MIEELHRFILVAKNSNITNTAKSVFITQSALSQSIQRLEKELGTKLFAQKGKTLYLTADGKAVLEIGEKIIELWEKAKNQNIRKSIRPVFSIGLFDSTALKLAKYFEKNLSKKEFDIELTISSSKQLLSSSQLGLLDLVICVIDKNNQENNNLLLIKTFSEELIPVSSKIFKDKIKNIPFVLYKKDSITRQYIDENFKIKNISPRVIAESTSITFMKELAIIGSGVAFLPKNYIKTELKQKILKKQNMPFATQRAYGIYIPKKGLLDINHALVKEIISNLK